MIQGPIRVITVEREYGSRGGEFAHDLAERLGWKLLDSELVKGAAVWKVAPLSDAPNGVLGSIAYWPRPVPGLPGEKANVQVLPGGVTPFDNPPSRSI